MYDMNFNWLVMYNSITKPLTGKAKLRNMFCQAYHSRTNIRCKNVNTPCRIRMIPHQYLITVYPFLCHPRECSSGIRLCPAASSVRFFRWRIKNGAVLIARPCRCHCCRFYLPSIMRIYLSIVTRDKFVSL